MAYGLVVEYYCLCRQDFSLDTDTDTDTVTVGGDRLVGNGQSVIAIISTMAGGHRHRSWFSGCCCCTVMPLSLSVGRLWWWWGCTTLQHTSNSGRR